MRETGSTENSVSSSDNDEKSNKIRTSKKTSKRRKPVDSGDLLELLDKFKNQKQCNDRWERQ